MFIDFIVFVYFTAASGTVPETHKSVNIQYSISFSGHPSGRQKKMQIYYNWPTWQKKIALSSSTNVHNVKAQGLFLAPGVEKNMPPTAENGK